MDHAGPLREVKVGFTEAVILNLRSEGWLRRRKFRQRGSSGPQGENTGRAGERWMWHWTSRVIQS